MELKKRGGKDSIIQTRRDVLRMITCVVPCYNEEAVLEKFYKEITRVADVMTETTFDFLFIDDGSKDATLSIIKKLASEDERVRYISFSRNFGKEAGIYAGLQNADGEYVVILDADLQHPPRLIKEMYHAIVEEGYDCAGTRRVNRKGESALRSFFAHTFYKLLNRVSKAHVIDGAQDYQMMNRKVIDAILQMGEYNRFSKGIFGWVGFRKKWIECENTERAAGNTKWSFWSLFSYAAEGVVAFTTAPLVMASVLGVISCLLSIGLLIFIVVKTVAFGDPTPGWPSLACLTLMTSGVQLFAIGILGQYLAKTYLESKHRPIYLVEETNLCEKNIS